ncbi:hypothetical protein LTR05_004816 [Lithohypha guttulata]|uniref:Uncharacterized protein n=1 Tax=Lithohypha guttulata TaxID=1690604 RepID=A0AAN7YAQ4_9EURO|nr:hypothetical protein LTR05_004816 [Lithohypha guttulata]
MATAPFTGAKRLRELLSDESKIVVAPGVFDGFTARLALQAGFDALYMNAAMIASLNPSVPVIADADTGYGGPIMVSRTVAQYARAGVAALHIEDQVQQKRCGHLLGKQLVDRETYYARLRAAVKTRNDIGSDMLIIARTDARQSYGFDEAVARLEEAVKIGVDVVFFEAMDLEDEAAKVCQIFKGKAAPFLNMVPGGTTPNMSVEKAQQLGFKIMIHPVILFKPIMDAVTAELATLKTTGLCGQQNAAAGVKDAFNLAGLQECMQLDEIAGGQAYSGVGE